MQSQTSIPGAVRDWLPRAARHADAERILKEGSGGVVEGMTPKLSSSKQVQSFVRSVIAQQTPMGLAVALDAMGNHGKAAYVERA